MNKPKLIEVVAGVLYNHDGAYLLSSRPEGKPYAGYWEFAGGKVEAGETRLAALQREFTEELGIEITSASPWLTRIHHYEHANVHLHFFRIAANQWHGQLIARENQSWHWQYPHTDTVTPMLPANAPILTALSIPTTLTGTLSSGFKSPDMQQPFSIFPYQPNISANNIVYAPVNQLASIIQQHPVHHIWAICHHVDQWAQAQTAAAVIWPLYNQQDQQQLLSLLHQNDINLPVFALYTQNYTDQIDWMSLGAHGVIYEQ